MSAGIFLGIGVEEDALARSLGLPSGYRWHFVKCHFEDFGIEFQGLAAADTDDEPGGVYAVKVKGKWVTDPYALFRDAVMDCWHASARVQIDAQERQEAQQWLDDLAAEKAAAWRAGVLA